MFAYTCGKVSVGFITASKDSFVSLIISRPFGNIVLDILNEVEYAKQDSIFEKKNGLKEKLFILF